MLSSIYIPLCPYPPIPSPPEQAIPAGRGYRYRGKYGQEVSIYHMYPYTLPYLYPYRGVPLRMPEDDRGPGIPGYSPERNGHHSRAPASTNGYLREGTLGYRVRG